MNIHPFSQRVRHAIRLQKQIARRFVDTGFPATLRYIGGADAAYTSDPANPTARAGAVGSPGLGIAVVWDLLEQRLIEARYARRRVDFPYIPGLLSFREAPLLRAAIRRIQTPVDAWLFDGQGLAHPRGIGLATHMGILLHAPAVGAAKSMLLGQIGAATEYRGVRSAPITHAGRELARALWTRPTSDPMIVSPGYRCTLAQAVDLILRCTLPDQRLPEPTRLADALTKQVRRLPPVEARRIVEIVVQAS